jgi:hypothetical protein
LGIQKNNIRIHPDNVQEEDNEEAAAEYGMKLLGTWIGSDEYVRANLQTEERQRGSKGFLTCRRCICSYPTANATKLTT